MGRPIASPIRSACCRLVSRSGPVRTGAVPACPGSVRARSATAAMSASWIGAVQDSGNGSRTVPSARIVPAHCSAFVAKPPGRRNVQAMPERATASSASPCSRAIGSADAASAPAADSRTMCSTPAVRARSVKPPRPCRSA
jgi:hypothetical protein